MDAAKPYDWWPKAWTKVTCTCGATEILAAPGLTFTELRCPTCPENTTEKPQLRLVKS